MKKNVLKSNKTIGHAAKELSAQQLTDKLNALRQSELKEALAELNKLKEKYKFEIIPIVQLGVDGKAATFEIVNLINGQVGYILR